MILYFYLCKVAGQEPSADTIIVGIVFITLFIAAVCDYKMRKIPNWLTYSAFCIVILFQLILNRQNITNSFLGMIICFGIVLIPYLLRQGGAGDVKLAAVIGAGMGFQNGITIIAVSYIIAATLGLIGIIWDKGPVFLITTIYHRVGHWFLPLWIDPPSEEQQHWLKEPIPLAPCFFVALIFVFFNGLEFLFQK
ncbi:MAG: A24 family peptidase [Planctomycetaceae bacterium]|nr:A24 family peptidase [Planctomycetaceae bacterium]